MNISDGEMTGNALSIALSLLALANTPALEIVIGLIDIAIIIE